MNKPRKTQPEPHAPIWSRRIFEALQRKRITQDKLSELSGVGGASLSSWIWGNSSGIYTEPKAEGLKNIARVLEVSTDYLLGLSDIPTSDIAVKGICEGTGLSVEAVKALQDMKVWNLGKWNLSMLNLMLENKSFSELLSRVADFAKANTSKEYSPGNGITYAEPELARMAVQTYMNGILNDLRVRCEGVIDSRDYFMMILLMKQTKRIPPSVFDEAMKITNLIFDDIGYPYEQLVKEGISDEAFLSELKKISELKC